MVTDHTPRFTNLDSSSRDIIAESSQRTRIGTLKSHLDGVHGLAAYMYLQPLRHSISHVQSAATCSLAVRLHLSLRTLSE